MERMNDLASQFATMQREAEEHARTCKLTVCVRCARFECNKCRAPQDREGLCGTCHGGVVEAMTRRNVLEAIPKAFHEATLDAPWLAALVGPQVLAEARVSVGEARVACAGPPGAGKTSLVAAMVMAGAVRRSSVLWVSAHQLAKARAFHRLGEGEAPLIARALDASFLVVDELGGEDQRYATAVAEVLYERHAQGERTWVTTGVGPKEIADRYGGGIARRVFEDAKVFRLKGRSR